LICLSVPNASVGSVRRCCHDDGARAGLPPETGLSDRIAAGEVGPEVQPALGKHRKGFFDIRAELGDQVI
jgi:hypothetical protein